MKSEDQIKRKIYNYKKEKIDKTPYIKEVIDLLIKELEWMLE